MLACLVVGLCVIGFQFVSLPQSFPSPYFPRHEAAKKYVTLKSLLAQGKSFDVVFMGSSIVDMGGNVVEFSKIANERGVAHSAFNFGINGAGPWVHFEVFRRLLKGLNTVKFIVYGISPVEVSSGSRLFLRDQKKFLDAAHLNDRDFVLPVSKTIKQALFENLNILRWREILWTSFFSFDSWRSIPGFKAERDGQQWIDFKVTNGWSWADQERRQTYNEDTTLRMRQLFDGFTVSGYNLEYLARLVAEARSSGAKVVLVNMPLLLEDAYLLGTAYEKMSLKDESRMVEKSDRALERFVADHKIPYLNCRTDCDFKPNDFADPLHLMSYGSTKLAKYIADVVVPKTDP